MATFVGNSAGFSVYDGKEILEVQAWGDNSARVRSTLGPSITETPGSALGDRGTGRPEIEVSDSRALMRNGELVVEVSDSEGKEFLHFPPLVRFLRPDGEELFAERVPHFSAPPQRRYRPGGGGLYRCDVSFRSFPTERFYGLGQHQHGLLDQKGAVIELVQRNTEVSVPFALSNRGYGFLWNMPGIGRAELSANGTKWVADGRVRSTTGSPRRPRRPRSLASTRRRLAYRRCCPNGRPDFGSASSATELRTSY